MYDCEKDKKVDDGLLAHERRSEGLKLINLILDNVKWSSDVADLVVKADDIKRSIYIYFGVKAELYLKEAK